MRRAVGLALAALLLAPAPAGAHITVKPATAKPGATVPLAFEVLNEREDATTVGVSVFLPAGLKTVDVPPHTGWKATVKRGAATEIDWTLTRQAAAIAGTRAQDFAVTLGPLPHGRQVVFKALQTYADGQVVRWIQDPGPDADRPAPALALGARSGGGGSSSLGFVVLAAVIAAAMAAGVLLARRRR
jgi:periplasmic copper chaperone A